MEKTPKRSIPFILGNLVRCALLIFLAVNIYAICLRFVPPPITILMMQRGLGGEDVRRDWTRLEQISPFVPQAVMAGEDTRFCEHRGIDLQAIQQAFEENQDGGRRRGGSTISQQTAKNIFFWNGGGYLRKAGEAWFASLIDFTWGKPRVMEVYLNVAEWGDGLFGIEAAAQNRFGKSAKDLTQQEAALLAAVLPSPNKWRLDPPSDFVLSRAETLRKRMAIIRNSNYAICVNEVSNVKGQSGMVEPKQPAIIEPAADVKSAISDDVLNGEGLSVNKEIETETENMTPKDPVNIPEPRPANVPSAPNEIVPEITPEAPREIPQEFPVENPPAEIPTPIDTPRVPPEP